MSRTVSGYSRGPLRRRTQAASIRARHRTVCCVTRRIHELLPTVPKILTITNPKRSARNLTGRDVWFPYYAGFSRTFATSLIRSAQIREDGWVLDPWNGSGTTTSSAFSLPCSSIGIDLNPVMAIAAKARILCRREKGSLNPLLVDILLKADSKKNKELSKDDALVTWFEPTAAAVVRNIERAIQQLLLVQCIT